MTRVYGYLRLRNQTELELFEEYLSASGQRVDKMFFDVVLGKKTTRKQLDKLLSQIRKGDLVVLRSFTNTCSTINEIYNLVTAISKKGVKIDIIKKSSGEQYFYTEEGVKALEMYKKTLDSLSQKENQAYLTECPETEEKINKVYDLFVAMESKELTVKEAAEELGVTEVSFYKYAQKLRK